MKQQNRYAFYLWIMEQPNAFASVVGKAQKIYTTLQTVFLCTALYRY